MARKRDIMVYRPHGARDAFCRPIDVDVAADRIKRAIAVYQAAKANGATETDAMAQSLALTATPGRK